MNYKLVRSFLYQMKTSPRTKTVSERMRKKIKKMLKMDGSEIRKEAVQELIEKYHLEAVRPLYTYSEAEQSLGYFEGVPYDHPITVGKDMTCTLYEAGHILGSAISIIRATENGHNYTIGYTGDLGRFGKPILRNPTLRFAEEDRDIDLLIMESTYGNRSHEPLTDLKPSLRKVITDTRNRGGSLIIPSFAFGRTQELIYVLHELYHEDKALRIPIYLDSPLAMKLTEVFGRHPEVYDRQTHADFLEKGENPFFFKEIRFVSSVEQSMSLMREQEPHIVIASSGMCEGGRILHHLRYKIHNERNTILIVGYMARNTLGRRILELGLGYERAGRKGEPPIVNIFNKAYPMKARVVELGGFSAHGDKEELLCFLQKSKSANQADRPCTRRRRAVSCACGCVERRRLRCDGSTSGAGCSAALVFRGKNSIKVAPARPSSRNFPQGFSKLRRHSRAVSGVAAIRGVGSEISPIRVDIRLQPFEISERFDV